MTNATIKEVVQKLISDSENNELRVRAAAMVASDTAAYMADQIESAVAGGNEAFRKSIEGYLQDLKWYARLRDTFDVRCEQRRDNALLKHDFNLAAQNGPLFATIADALKPSVRRIEAFTLAAVNAAPASSGEGSLHLAKSGIELTAGLYHDIHPVGHLIGPATDLVITVIEMIRHRQSPPRNQFENAAEFFRQIEDVAENLRKIAVGVYRVPDFWPQLVNSKKQLVEKGIVSVDAMSASSPVPVRDAEKMVETALARNRVGGISFQPVN